MSKAKSNRNEETTDEQASSDAVLKMIMEERRQERDQEPQRPHRWPHSRLPGRCTPRQGNLSHDRHALDRLRRRWRLTSRTMTMNWDLTDVPAITPTDLAAAMQALIA